RLRGVDARQRAVGRDDVQVIAEELHRARRAAAGRQLPQARARLVEAVDARAIVAAEDVFSVGRRRAREHLRVARVHFLVGPALGPAVDLAAARRRVNRRLLLPAEEDVALRLLAPDLAAVFPVVHRHAAGVAVVHAELVAADHPAGAAFA